MSKCTQWVDNGVVTCKEWGNELDKTCTTWADEGSSQCKQWADQGSNECSQWADEGYSECDQWADEGYKDCCDWWPCSWACKAWVWVSNWVCKAWKWVAKWVCKAWYWVAKWVCVAWYWVAKWVCKAWAWVLKVVCTVWGWVAKLVCVAWQNIICALFPLWRIFRGRMSRSPRITHVFVLMLENRSFDHALGFSGITGTDAVTGLPTIVEGLVPNSQSNIDPANPGVQVFADTPAPFKIPDEEKDPAHEFDNALEQLCGAGAVYPDPLTGDYPLITNSGFISSYRDKGSSDPLQVMKCFSRDQLPVLNALAEEFAVCDHWFSSMPGPTWPNRFFIHAASSGGLDDSPSGFEVVSSSLVDGYKFEHGSIFDALDARCIDWEIFEGDETPQSFAISGMNLNALQGRFTDFEDFAAEVMSPGFPSSYVFIEPDYGNILPTTPEDYTCGTSQHPLDDVTRGERLIKEVYEAIRNSPLWPSSLLLVVYDEHGGFFDHVAPPKGVWPGDKITDEDNNHHDFSFKQLGVRVPAIVISPLIPRNVIDHTEYDHTSFLATLEKLFSVGSLTNRDAAANNFLHLLSLKQPRLDAPTVLPDPAPSGFRCEDDSREADMVEMNAALAYQPWRFEEGKVLRSHWEDIDPKVRSLLHLALLKHLSLVPLTQRKERKQIVNYVLSITTEIEAREYIHTVRLRVRAAKGQAGRRRIKRIRRDRDNYELEKGE
jgi:phospholipase C